MTEKLKNKINDEQLKIRAISDEKITVKLTNNYAFQKIFKNTKIVKGFLMALLDLKEYEIKKIEITDPFTLGENDEEKEGILDIKLILNQNRKINIEMQNTYQDDWGDVSAVKQLGLAALLGSVVMAFGIGFYDGFFGPGTGSFLIFGFLFLGYDFVTAAGNAKALNFASGIGALLSFTLSGSVLWTYGLLMGFAMVIGAYFGSRMAIRHGASYVKPLYLIVTTLLIGKQVYELLFK